MISRGSSDLKVLKKEEPEPSIVWRCYDCGSTEGFATIHYEWAGDYDCECTKCGSLNTHEDGNGTPECECGTMDWYCDKCSLCKCSECWKWFSVKEEPEDYICKDCGG